MAWEVGVFSDVYMGRRSQNEDGDVGEELCFYIVLTDENGFRFGSKRTWSTEDMPRHLAEERARRYTFRVQAALEAGADPRRSDKWVRRQGAYGSAAWDERDELDLEARGYEAEGVPAEQVMKFRFDNGIL